MKESAPKFEIEEHKTIKDSLPHLPEIETSFAARALKMLGFVGVLAVSPVEKATAEGHELTVEESAVVESVLGAELVRKLRAKGFEFTIPVAADENGSYIIHVGQMHRDSLKADSEPTSPDALGLQQDLLTLLPDIVKIGDGVVFHESVGEVDPAIRTSVQELAKQLQWAKEIDIDTIDTALRATDIYLWYNKNSENSYVQNYIPPELGEEVLGKLKSFAQSFEPSNETEQNYITKLNSLFEQIPPPSKLGFHDAVKHLYMEGKVEIAPTETYELSERAREVVLVEEKAYQQLWTLVFKALQNDPKGSDLYQRVKELSERKKAGILTTEEEQEFKLLYGRLGEMVAAIEKSFESSAQARAYEAAKKEVKNVTFAQREFMVLDKIREYEQKVNVSIQFPVVVYGARHKFGPELKEYNKRNPEEEADRGLIEIRMGDYNHYFRNLKK